MKALEALGAPWILLTRTLLKTRTRSVKGHLIWRQIYETGSESAPLVILGMAFFGIVMVSIAQQQAVKLVGNIALVGPAYFELLVRELGPVLSALLATSRISALHSAELASMTVNEQVEALQMSAGDVFADLVAPRVLGGLIAFPFLCIIGTSAASLSAMWTVKYLFQSNGYAFIDARYVDATDVMCGAVKTLLCGLYVPLVAAHRGLQASEGTSAVGMAVTRGVVESSIGCLAIDFIVALFFQELGA